MHCAAIDERIIFTMCNDRHPDFSSVLHRFIHHSSLLYTNTVVGERECAMFFQLSEIRSFLAGFPNRDGCVWKYTDQGLLFYQVIDKCQIFFRIWYRPCTWHGVGTLGVAAFCRCPCSAFDCLFMFAARLTKVDVDINESRCQ